MKVSIHRNLNKKGTVYTIRHKGKVVAYADTVTIRNAVFKHATQSALSKLRTGSRFVCAWVTGELVANGTVYSHHLAKVQCDPRRVDFFSDCQGKKLDKANFVLLEKNGVFFC